MIRSPVFSYPQYALRLMTAAVAAALVPGWVCAQTAAPTPTDDANAPTNIRSDSMTGRPDREMFLEKNVEIVRGSTKIDADKATYDVVEDQVDASGNITIQRADGRYTGDELKFKMDTGAGYVLNPTYKLFSNNGQGRAERIDFESSERAHVTAGTYSTCEGPDPDWYLQANTMDLDSARDTGSSSTTMVYFKGVPIMGSPFLSFPLSDARKSGVLPPTIGVTNNGGAELTVPYYFNIAPNRDFTLYPHIIAERGLQLGGDARYLGNNYRGQTKFEYLPNDRLAGIDRYALVSTHYQNLRPGLAMSWNYNAASDGGYPSDFLTTMTNASQRTLAREGNLRYDSKFWHANALISQYQILQDPASYISPPYKRVPQLTLYGGRQNVGGFDWAIDSEYTRFWLAQADASRTRGADRFVVNPSVSYPIINPGYFLTPKLSLNASSYHVLDPVGGTPTNLTRVLPTFSLDSGLVFERSLNLFGSDLTQTLEPRLFYVYTPYLDQSLYPNFDSAEADISLAQMASENRFSGRDRIGDANQITASLVSRFLDDAGTERLNVSVSQRFSLTPARVTSAGTTNASRSDVLLAVSGRLTPTVRADSSIQISERGKEVNRAVVGMQWQPRPKHVLNLQYRYDVRDTLAEADRIKQFEVSGQWPLAKRLFGVMRTSYSIPDRRLVTGLAGLEYNADCWVFRFVGQRTTTATNQTTTGFFIQLELNGLSKIGSNPMDTLRSAVPGYQVVNQP